MTPISCDCRLIQFMLLREIGKLSAQRDDMRWRNIGCIDEGNQSRVKKYGYVFHAVGQVEMAQYWSYIRDKLVRCSQYKVS